MGDKHAVHKATPAKTSIDELIAMVAVKIRSAERQVLSVHAELDLASESGDVPLTSEKVAELSKWLARRRALIEVWELASNQVWHSQIVKLT